MGEKSRFKQNGLLSLNATMSGLGNHFPRRGRGFGQCKAPSSSQDFAIACRSFQFSSFLKFESTNSSDLNAFKCLPGHFLVPLSLGGLRGFLRIHHRRQQVNKKKNSEEEMQMRSLSDHYQLPGWITTELLLSWLNQSALRRMIYQRKSKYIQVWRKGSQQFIMEPRDRAV